MCVCFLCCDNKQKAAKSNYSQKVILATRIPIQILFMAPNFLMPLSFILSPFLLQLMCEIAAVPASEADAAPDEVVTWCRETSTTD